LITTVNGITLQGLAALALIVALVAIWIVAVFVMRFM
jgi:hypothetical protein